MGGPPDDCDDEHDYVTANGYCTDCGLFVGASALLDELWSLEEDCVLCRYCREEVRLCRCRGSRWGIGDGGDSVADVLEDCVGLTDAIPCASSFLVRLDQEHRGLSGDEPLSVADFEDMIAGYYASSVGGNPVPYETGWAVGTHDPHPEFDDPITDAMRWLRALRPRPSS